MMRDHESIWPRRLCRDHPVAAFLVLAFTLSWPVMIAFRGHQTLVPIIGVPPSLAAFFVVLLGHGKTGLRRLARRGLIVRVGLRRWAFALLAVGLTVWVISYGVTAAFFPAELTPPSPAIVLSAPLNFVAILVLAGLGEEFGWRGLAQARLQDRHGALVAALVVGVAWFAWHLPLYVGTEDWMILQAAFLAGVVADSVILAWLFNVTGGSVLLVAVMHAAGNTWGGLAFENVFSFSPPGFLFFEVLRQGCYVAVALVVVVATRGRVGHAGGRNGVTNDHGAVGRLG